MQDIEHARTLLAMARKDLKALQKMEQDLDFDTEIFGFHAQQVIEKSLKAWLSMTGTIYPKTHDLDELLALLKDKNEPIPKSFESLTIFTDFAVQFRYEAYATFEETIDRPETFLKISNLVNHVDKIIER